MTELEVHITAVRDASLRASNFYEWCLALNTLAATEDATALGLVNDFLTTANGNDFNEGQAIEKLVTALFASKSPERTYDILSPYVSEFFADKTKTPKVALRAVFDLKNTVEANRPADPRWFELLAPKFGLKEDVVGEMHHYIPTALALLPAPKRLEFWWNVQKTSTDLGMIVLRGLARIKNPEEAPRVIEVMRGHLGDSARASSVAIAASALLAHKVPVSELKEPLMKALARVDSDYDAKIVAPVVSRVAGPDDIKAIKEIVKAIKARPAETAYEKKARSGAAKVIDELAKSLKPE